MEEPADGFECVEHNLDVPTQHHLQDEGANVYFAPLIAPNVKVVNLDNGHVERFAADEPRPQVGYYADFTSLARFCRYNGMPLTETDA